MKTLIRLLLQEQSYLGLQTDNEDNEDPDQTCEEQSDLGLNSLPSPICLKT